MSEQAKCELCGGPMPPGEEMFNFHGYSGPCPKPPLPKPSGYKVTAKCENGHEQSITLQGMTKEWAESYAGLLDGTSPFYIYPPNEKSVIGKCGICGKTFKCKIEEVFNA